MPSAPSTYLFCADYSSMATCLYAIDAQQQGSGYSPAILQLLQVFGQHVAYTYKKAARIQRILSGEAVGTTGDFEDLDFSSVDFFTGNAEGQGSSFQDLLVLLQELCPQEPSISLQEKLSLDNALVNLLNSFDALQEALLNEGHNPCGVQGYFNNSPDLYLQAAGSDGTDGIPAGIHLRWILAGELGRNHLPKGNYAADPASPYYSLEGYNKPSDFVVVTRCPYDNRAEITLDFETGRPVIEHATKTWTYRFASEVNGQQVTSVIRLSFQDVREYERAALLENPSVDPFKFLNSYNGTVLIGFVSKLAYSFKVLYQRATNGPLNGILKIEATSAAGRWEGSASTTSVRKTISLGTSQEVMGAFVADNIKSILFKKTEGSIVKAITFETYHDFVQAHATGDWEMVGDNFALSLEDTTVYSRLESPNYPLNLSWPHYNGGKTVEVSVYKQKWANSSNQDETIKTLVENYLLTSRTDPRAIFEFVDPDAPAGGPPPEEGVPLKASLLDLIQVIGMDYHLARMLGLGHIDTPTGAAAGGKFMYRVKYIAKASLAADANELVTYEFLSLPTGTADHRKPAPPTQRPITYTPALEGDPDSSLFDAQGYSANFRVRVINIGREAYPEEQLDRSFFNTESDSGDFNLSESPRPILYGIEYRAEGQTNFVTPEITARGIDPTDTDGEPVPVPDNPHSLFIHHEENTGVHYYAVYGINLLARVSDLSGEEATDNTEFPLLGTLVPPTDAAVQYIQKEEPLLFTSQQEQAWLRQQLQDFPGQDVNFTRVTFNWVDMAIVPEGDPQDTVRPTEIRVFFREAPPLEIRGKISHMEEIPSFPQRVAIFTESYPMIGGISEAIPAFVPGDAGRFIGSLLSTDDGEYEVVAVASEADWPWPVITVKKNVVVETVEHAVETDFYGARKEFRSPTRGSRFLVLENLAEAGNWHQLEKRVTLEYFPPTEEKELDQEGNETTFSVGGIKGAATVSPVTAESVAADGTVLIEVVPGYFHVQFGLGVTLPPHSQDNPPPGRDPSLLQEPHVTWYKGVLRVPVMEEGRVSYRALEVVQIIQDPQKPLALTVYDPIEPAITDPVATPSWVGATVNFHPGYKVLFYPEPLPNHHFKGANILPDGTGEYVNDKKTLMALQAVAPELQPPLASRLSSPLVLLARDIQEPVTPVLPEVIGYKVRPDARGKGAFTFDVPVSNSMGGQRAPYAFMFYRTTFEEVLDVLYQEATITQIYQELATFQDNFYYNRMAWLVKLDLVTVDGVLQFKPFNGESYRFPTPDKVAAPTLELLKATVLSTFLPLTEQPVVFSLLKEGNVTENKLPSTRNLDGEHLEPGDAGFDPFPMARKRENGAEVRFTDYQLEASSRSPYFYAVSEISKQYQVSLPSNFLGPVLVLRTMAAEPPLVKSFSVRTDQEVDGVPVPVSVHFSVGAFAPEEGITKIRIFRTGDPEKAHLVRHMDPGPEWPVGEEVVDTFEGVPVPFGTVYYRLAGVRTIVNEEGVLEDVLSQPSEWAAVELVDTKNPEAPEILFDGPGNRIHWAPTVPMGKYQLFQMNGRGNWTKVPHTVHASTHHMEYALPNPLPRSDENGDPVYYRFKVRVENASGLANLVDREVTI